MDVHDPARGPFGRVEPQTSNQAFDALIDQVMSAEPYRHVKRVFVIVDNGTIHRGQKAIDRVAERWSNLVLVHLPVHASWLNQIEIYFSILARKALTPCDFASLEQLTDRVLAFQQHYQTGARPFDWTFTRDDLNTLVARLHEDGHLAAAA